MSGTPRDDSDGRDGAAEPDRPMLVLGEDLPDVEDTTIEELRAQEAALERQRRELAEQAEQERDLARQRLASQRREAERELARRQREIDDAERRLVRTERRLRRQAARMGQEDRVPRVSTTGTTRSSNRLLAGAREVSSRRIPHLQTVITLLVAAMIALVVGAALSASRADERDVATFEGLDESRALLREATDALDSEIVRQATGEPAAPDADGDLGSAGLARIAFDRGDVPSYYRDDLEPLNAALSSTDTAPVRAATTWEETRNTFRYAVSSTEVDDARENITPGSPWATTLMWGGALVLLGVTVVLWRSGARLAAGFTLAGLLASGLALAQDPFFDGVTARAEAHEEAVDRADDVRDEVRRDLEVMLGLRALAPYEQGDDGFWEQTYGLEELGVAHDEWAQARAELGDALAQDSTTEELRSAALGVIDAAGEASVDVEAEVETLRQSVVDTAEQGWAPGLVLPGLALVILLPVAGLGIEAWRRRQEGEDR